MLDARMNGVELVPLRRYPDALIPAGGRDHWRDWYGIRNCATGHLRVVPGAKRLVDGSYIWHRSHLPLLGDHVAKLARTLNSGVSPEFADGTVLRAHQVLGACWLRQRAGALLADGMRVGKTGQIVAAHDPVSGPLVVSAPLNTRRVWLRWMRRRWPGQEIAVVLGTAPSEAIKSAPLVFCHHEVLGYHQVLGSWRPGTLVADEAHRFSNPRSIRSQGLGLLATNAQRVIAATGTPLWNKPTGLYPILSAVNPGAWGSWRDYAERYCGGHPGPYGMIAEGASNLDEFRDRLSEVMLRREWGDAGLEAPETKREIITVDLTADEQYELDKLAENLRAASSARRVPAADLARVRQVVGRRKVAAAVERSRLAGDEPHVIWTWHRDIAKDIAARVGGICVIGETPATRREQLFDAWEERGGALVVTMSVGEVGIDLSAARRAIFAELDWTPATLAQAEMRTFSPERSMEIEYIAADHRVDRAIVKALGKKLDLSRVFGVPAADGAIDVIGSAFEIDGERADLERLARELVGGGVKA